MGRVPPNSLSKAGLPCGMSMVQYEGGWQCIDGKLIAPPPKLTAIDYGMGYSKKARPSPRTLGKTVDPVTKKEVFFTKFGTQQLKFIDPAKPALGVKQLNVGQTFKGFTTGLSKAFAEQGFTFGAPTVRDTAYPDLTITKGVGTTTPDPFPPNGNGNGEPTPTCTTCDSDKCQECNAWDIPCELGHMASGTCTPPVTPPTPTCECEACINGTGECSDKKPCCNAWDILCEMGGECSKPKPPEECAFFDIGCKGGKWWDKYGLWVMLIGGIIGLGILLWLLRPLFGIAKNITEI